MRGILWDLDGTLLDTLDDLTDAVNMTLRKMNYPERSLEEIRSFVGNGAARLIAASLPDGDMSRFDEAFGFFREYYARHSNDKTRPYTGIPKLLEQLKEEGFAMGILSNKPDFAVKDLAKRYFPCIDIAAGEIPGVPRKPEPDGLMLVMDQMGVSKENCIYIGDSEVDITTAANAGIPCITVTWGFRDKRSLQKAGAIHTADSIEELADRIRFLFAEA